MARALAAAVVVSLLAVSGAGGADVQTPKRGGTVVFGPVREPACLATFLPICRGVALTPAFEWVSENVVPPAYIVDRDFVLRPRLVSDVDYTTRPPFTLTYHLRPEARWSDGAAITARDFVFSHNVIRRFVASDSGDIHLQVRSVRAVDAKTVRVVLRARQAGWRELFWTVLPAACARGRAARRDLGERDRQPEDGAAHRQRPFPRGTLGARQAAHARPKPQLLGAARCTSRPDRHPICEEVCIAHPRLKVRERTPSGRGRLRVRPGHGHLPRPPADPRASRSLRGLEWPGGLDIGAGPRKSPRAAEQERPSGTHLRDRSGRPRPRRLFGEIDPK